MLGPKWKHFWHATDKISSEQLRKVEKIKPFGHSRASKNRKKCYILIIFLVLGNLTNMQQFGQILVRTLTNPCNNLDKSWSTSALFGLAKGFLNFEK